MSYSYLYEIQRKSQDFEQHLQEDQRENSNLSDYSKDEDIWEVPEESFDNIYQQIEGNEEILEQQELVDKDINKLPEVLNLPTFSNTKSLHISLSTEKIALKPCTNQQQGKNYNITQAPINKTINTDADLIKSMTGNSNTTKTTATSKTGGSKVQWKNCKLSNNNSNTKPSLNFAIVPINVSTQKTAETEEAKTIEKLPEIKLTSFISRKNSLKPMAMSSNLKTKTAINDMKTLTNLPQRKSSNGSEINKHITESSTSPESLLDNVLSYASSVSIQSSSLSSNDLDVNCIKPLHFAHTSSLTPYKNIKNNTGLSKTIHIPELKIITASNSPTNQEPLNVGAHASLSLLTTSNISHTDSFETASNRTRSPSASPLRSLSPKVPNEVSLYPDDLKCKICNELFNDPRSLNCLHSFCFQCIVNENFKQDASIPFWSQPQKNDKAQGCSLSPKHSEEQDVKALSSFHYSAPRSASPDGRTAHTNPDLTNTTSQQKRRPSFTFRRKKSSERLTLKNKSDNVSMETSQKSIQQNKMTRLINCKICQYPTKVPMGGIRQLPQNFVLVRRIEEIRYKVGEEVITRILCSLCFEETNATYHCLTCILNLCTLCKEAHERQKTTIKHNIKSIIELRKIRKEQGIHYIDNTKFILKCNMHPGFDVKSFCLVCLQVACSDCLILLHKGHKYESITKAANSFCKILQDSSNQTKPLCKYAEHSIARLDDISKAIATKCDRVQAEVEDFMIKYFEALEAHKNTLLQQVQRVRVSKVEMIAEQQMDLEKRSHDATMAIKFCEELTDIASDVEILSFAKILLKRFEYCQQFKAPKISDNLHFLPKIRAPAAKNQHDIPLFGIITMQTADPSLCTLQWDGVSQVRLYRKAELVLISRDRDGASLCHGGLHIRCQIRYRDNQTKLLPIEVSDNRDGTYIISFIPDSQGILILTITINDKPIKGSPFCLQARALRPHSGIFHCCSFCSTKGNKGIRCGCEGRMPGFNGCGHGHVGHPGRRHWSCCGNVLENSECTIANKL